MVQYTYNDSEWKDLLTAYNGNTITYDAIGNPLTYYNGTSFTWSSGRSLTGLTTAGGANITYKYNEGGIRTSKTVNGTQTYYYLDGSDIIAQKTGNNTYWFEYDAAGNRHSITYNGATYYYYYNLQGDVIGLYDANLNVVVNYTYDSWGKVLSVTGSMASTLGQDNPFRYRGYYYDSDTGLYYLNSRYYDPEIGRFLNADGYLSTGQGVLSHNMFAYCNNNPIMFIDPTGMSSKIFDTITEIVERMINIIYDIIAISDDKYLNQKEKQQNATIIYNSLKREGWSHNAICAVLGNMEQESTINPGFYQRDGSAYGLVQWDPSTKYTNWATKNGYAYDSISGQLKYLVYSMQPGKGEWFKNSKHPEYYLSYSDFVTSNSSIDYLTVVFLHSYERAGVAKLENRIKYANYWSDYFS